MAVAPGQGIIGHRYADGHLQMYVALNRPESWTASIDLHNNGMGLAQIAEEFRGWAPHLLTLITESDTEPILRPTYALPASHRWERRPGVTLLGDAAHLMSPFAGEGANLAMYDGSQLATFLVAHATDTERGLAAYETDLFPRSERFASMSAKNLQRFFDSTAPQSVVDLFPKHLA